MAPDDGVALAASVAAALLENERRSAQAPRIEASDVRMSGWRASGRPWQSR